MSETDQAEPTAQGNRPAGHDDWTVWDPERENAHHYEERGDADDKLDMAADLGVPAELFPPGESPEALYHAPDERDDTAETADDSGNEDDGVPCAECGGSVDPSTAEFDAHNDPYHPDCLHGDEIDADFVDHSDDSQAPDAVPVENADSEPVDPTPEPDDLPDRSVADDPLTWIPGDFVDEIDGTQAINRKGFEVLSHFYDISVSAECQTPPEETDHQYCRVKATATTEDGRECEAFGSSHVDRDDDPELLLEMADTRARKRALSIATGVGAVAVAELKSEVQQ